jgi:CysZ protein
MLRAFLLSLAQFGDPRFVRVFAKSLLLTFALFAAFGAAIWWALRDLAQNWLDGGTASGVAGVASVVILILVGWTLFSAIAIGVISLFVDDIIVAVEAKHYPQALATARKVSFVRSALMGLGSALRLLLANIVAAPVYLVLLVTGVGTAIALLVVNGWVLGRDLTDMVAARHLSAGAMRDWRATTRTGRFVLGLAAAALFVVPVVNLVAPVLAAAMATHWFHSRRGSA